MCLAETYVYVGCLRFAWVATYADRKETVQTLAARPAIASLPRRDPGKYAKRSCNSLIAWLSRWWLIFAA
jgi:hypothetical protein